MLAIISKSDAEKTVQALTSADYRATRIDSVGGFLKEKNSTLLIGVRNEPGSLHRVLGVLATHGLNMSKLESRPSRDRARCTGAIDHDYRLT